MYHNKLLVLEWVVKQYEKNKNKFYLIIFSYGLALGKRLEVDYKVNMFFFLFITMVKHSQNVKCSPKIPY
jgi:hypothetical protein